RRSVYAGVLHEGDGTHRPIAAHRPGGPFQGPWPVRVMQDIRRSAERLWHCPRGRAEREPFRSSPIAAGRWPPPTDTADQPAKLAGAANGGPPAGASAPPDPPPIR